MNELIDVATRWHSLPLGALIFMLTFGVAPGLALRLIVLIYPKDDPRRQELVAQLYVLGRLERLQFVGEQLETALTDGLVHRIKQIRARTTKKLKKPKPPKHTDALGEIRFMHEMRSGKHRPRPDALLTMLQTQIKRICKGDGIQRHNSPQWVDSRAHHYFGIPRNASLEGTVAAVSDRFNELIPELPESLHWIARHCLNLTGNPDIERRKLVERQGKLADAGGPSRSKCIQLMKEVIAPELARLMIEKYGPQQGLSGIAQRPL